jgi:hypothetical protein
VIVAATRAVTGPVATVNVAVVAPGGTVTVDGTLAAVALLPRTMTAPPAGAAALSVTVPCVDVPPLMLPTGNASETSDAAGGETVSVALRLVAPYSAVITTSVGTDTGDVVIVNATLVAPAGIVTDVGVVAADAMLLEMAMRAPPVGAAGAIEMVPWADDPPSTVDGAMVTDVTPAGWGVSVSVAVTVAP